MRFYSLIAAAALLSASLTARADVIYTYFDSGSTVGQQAGAFTIDSPTVLPYSANLGSGFPVTTGTDLTYMYAVGHNQDLGTIQKVSFSPAGLVALTSQNAYEVLFTGSYDIGTNGVYTSSGPSTYGATLTISGVPPIAATPEPSSLALLGTGLLGVIGVARKRFA